MSTQEEAIKKVGEAFASGPGSGMTPEQLAAYKRVQEAFTPRSADQIIDSPQKPLQLGVVDPDTTESYRSTQSVMDATPESMLAGFEATRQRDLDTQRAEQETLQKERKDLAQQQSKVMEGFSQEELIRDERKELGVQKMIDEQMLAIQSIRGLREQYTNLEQQKGEALALSDGRVAPVGFIRGEQARIAEQFDRRQSVVSARMGAETAHMQAMSGMAQQARGLIGDIVNAATFDTELELNRIQIFRDVNAQELSELDQSIQNQLSESQRYWENRLQTERNEKTQVMELMIQAPGAGITVNDTVEQAVQKASAWGLTQMQIAQASAGAQTYEQWKNSEEANSIINAEQERRKMSFTSEEREMVLQEEYNKRYGQDEEDPYLQAQEFVKLSSPLAPEDELVNEIRRRFKLQVTDAQRVVRSVRARQELRLTPEYVEQNILSGFSDDDIKTAFDQLRESGEVSGSWFFGVTTKGGREKRYLEWLMSEVEKLREEGYDDFEIEEILFY